MTSANQTICDKFIRYHAMRVFFQSPDKFKVLCSTMGLNFDMDRQTYSDMFYGTDSDIYVPLWASVAKTGEDVLLNHVTLDVIKFYKAYGYEPVRMDGNPADFAGEQVRFLEYLAACVLNGSMDQSSGAKAIMDFEDLFLVDTLHMIASAIRDQFDRSSGQIKFVLDLLEDPPGTGIYSSLSFDPGSADSYSWKKRPAVSVEEPHVISFASGSDCGSKCKMLATVCEGCLLAVEPDTSGTPIRFSGCPRGQAYGQTFLTSRRLRFPMERTAKRGEGKFRRISWEDAVEKIADATRSARRKYGPGSRFVINASGVSSAVRGDQFMKNLLACDGGYLAFYNYYSAACATYTTPYIYGKLPASNHESTYLDSKLMIMWGFNPADCHYGLLTKEFFMKARENGTKVIVIDPRMSDTVLTMADKWIPIRPSSDTALIDAMAYVIWKEGLQDQEFMDRFCIGFDEDHMPDGVPFGESYHSHVFGVKDGIEKTPHWAEQICGISAHIIHDLAVEYATSKPAAIFPGYATQRTMTGEQACFGFAALCCMTGNVGVSGGSTGVFHLKDGHDCPSMAAAENPYPGLIPVFQWTRAIDRPETMNQEYTGLRGVKKLDSGIKVLYSLVSGTVINQHSNINNTRRILTDSDKLDHLIVSDLFMTPSAKFADILLPGASFFECDNIPATWGRADYLLYCNHITSPLFESRFEYYWIREMAYLMELGKEFDNGNPDLESWIRQAYENCRLVESELPDFETFKKDSYYVYKHHKPKVAFEDNIKNGTPFSTPSGKIEIFSKTLYDLNRHKEIPGRAGYIECTEGPKDPLRKKYPLQLIAYHTKRRCHSQHEINALLRELDPTALWINPEDASARGICDGDLVEAFNDRGVMRITAKVTERIMPGVIAVSEGGWYKAAPDGADIGGCINVLTSTEKATPLANGNPQHTNLADVRKAAR